MIKQKIHNPDGALLVKIGLAIGEVYQARGGANVIFVQDNRSFLERFPPHENGYGMDFEFSYNEIDLNKITFVLKKTSYFIVCGHSKWTGNVYVNLDTLCRLSKDCLKAETKHVSKR